MPIIKSAKKRVRVARKATIRNAKTKRNLKTALKAFQSSLTSTKKTGDSHAKAQSALDKVAKKGIMHKNKIARKKRQLAAQAKAAGIKPSVGTKKVAPKKTATKKAAPAKKTTVKKAAPKKTAIKKPASKKSAKK